MLWDASGAIDLNSLIDPTSGWTLSSAVSISETNWVSGFGWYQIATGDTIPRLFLLQVPEPAGIAPLALLGLIARRRR